ncbi:UvrD-helicase domain-containing protein [Nocardia fusca]|uniref:UvrD-helicase domain-containing protein n=1 Tax=Nocardia fusca TaxID=941183 RepID=A0ABV3FBL0_9NOCA
MRLVASQQPLLTRAQREIVERPWNARVLVTAGAGAGKTTTLTYRLEHLTSAEVADDEGPLAASEILVLSFSRAAVRSLRDRIDHIAGSARRVRAFTFDGWARSILRAAEPDRDLTAMSFDEIIDATREAIRGGIFDDEIMDPPSHVVIDEVQDLVDVRREMVQALLESTREYAGFTVVGDAAQSVYGFQVEDLDERVAETNRFFGWLRTTFEDELVEARLDDNFRATTPEARAALGFGPRLQQIPADRTTADKVGRQIYAELCRALEELPDFGDLKDEFTLSCLREAAGSTAILCATNGQVLHIADKLAWAGVPYTIQRSPRSRPAPTWLVSVFRGADGAQTISERRFSGIVSDRVHDPVRAWRALRRVAAGNVGGVLDLGSLHRAIADQRIPDELINSSPRGVLLSTVHRAKGLEFDRVIVVEPHDHEESRVNEDPAGSARHLYVAMTRAREDNYRLAPFFTTIRSGTKRTVRFDRWYKAKKWKKSFSVAGLELAEHDVARATPAQGDGAAAATVQKYLEHTVRPGDSVCLISKVRPIHDPDNAPRYGIWHGETCIGETSERFCDDLRRALLVHPGWEIRSWPERIEGAQIDCVESIGGSTAESARSGLGPHGIWLAPRLCGLGAFRWGKTSADAEDEVEE